MDYADRWLACDPMSDEAVRLAIEARYLSGDRGAAASYLVSDRGRARSPGPIAGV